MKSRLRVRRLDKTVLRTASPAGLQHIAFPTAARQCFLLMRAETAAHRGPNHACEIIDQKIASSVFRIDVMIAGVYVAVMLDRHRAAALP